MRAFWTVLTKELISFFRSAGLVFIVIYFFTADVYVAGEGIKILPHNVTVGYVDKSEGALAKRILSHLREPEFLPPKPFVNQRELYKAIKNKEIVVGLVFDANFERRLAKEHKSQLNVLLDSTAASQGYITLVYLQNILANLGNLKFPVELKLHKLFNQNVDSRQFIGYAELLSILTLLGIIFSAIVFVKEKEDGTWDMMLLMPVDARWIILAKALSQILILILGVVLSMGLVLFGVFNMPMNGSFFAFLFLTFLYSFTLAGIGLFIAAVSQTVMQVAQISVLIAMPLIFLSGAWTPIYAMDPFLQKLSVISPLRYYIEGSISIVFRGASIDQLWPYFVGTTLLGIVTFLYGFRKIGRLF